MIKKGPHEPDFAYDIVRNHSLMIDSDLVGYNTVGDTKAPLLRCFPFISKLKGGDIIPTGQYLDYQTFSHLQFRSLLENSFHSIHRGTERQRGRGFTALAQVFGRTAIPFLRKYVVPAGKRIGADVLEFAPPEIGEVISGRKSFKSAAKSVGKQILKKTVGWREPHAEGSLSKGGREVVNRGESFQQILLSDPVGREETFL